MYSLSGSGCAHVRYHDDYRIANRARVQICPRLDHGLSLWVFVTVRSSRLNFLANLIFKAQQLGVNIPGVNSGYTYNIPWFLHYYYMGNTRTVQQLFLSYSTVQ